MAASLMEIKKWFDNGVKLQATYMIVVYDSLSDDYPLYVSKSQNVHDFVDEIRMGFRQRVMEVYDLNADRTEQLRRPRNFSLPEREAKTPENAQK